MTWKIQTQFSGSEAVREDGHKIELCVFSLQRVKLLTQRKRRRDYELSKLSEHAFSKDCIFPIGFEKC